MICASVLDDFEREALVDEFAGRIVVGNAEFSASDAIVWRGNIEQGKRRVLGSDLLQIKYGDLQDVF